MGSFLYPITLVGPLGEETVEALVDTGATYILMPGPLLERLGVRRQWTRPFSLADGRSIEYGLGETTVRINGEERTSVCIFGDAATEPLLGVYTLEGFMLGVDPVNHTLIPVVGRLMAVASPTVAE